MKISRTDDGLEQAVDKREEERDIYWAALLLPLKRNLVSDQQLRFAEPFFVKSTGRQLSMAGVIQLLNN
jgi:hypothetical protein